MKLHPQLVTYIAETLMADLVKEKKVSVHDDRLLAGLIEHTIEDEMDVEAQLDEEVREVLSEHYEQMRAGGVSYDEMFRKVKAKLARDKGIVL